MPINKTFSETKQKISKIWGSTNENKIKIVFKNNKRDVLISELNKPKTSQQVFNKITDWSSDWSDMMIKTNTSNEPIIAVLNWSIDIQGLDLVQLTGLRYTPLLRFGDGSLSVEYEIQLGSSFLTTYYLEVKTINEIDRYIFHYGIMLTNFSTLKEIENGIQVKLQVNLFNPNLYYSG